MANIYLSEGWDESSEAVEQTHARHDCQTDEPEPEEDVDLLVEDVQGEDAETVVGLHCTGRSVFVEGAFGHLWGK